MGAKYRRCRINATRRHTRAWAHMETLGRASLPPKVAAAHALVVYKYAIVQMGRHYANASFACRWANKRRLCSPPGKKPKQFRAPKASRLYACSSDPGLNGVARHAICSCQLLVPNCRCATQSCHVSWTQLLHLVRNGLGSYFPLLEWEEAVDLLGLGPFSDCVFMKRIPSKLKGTCWPLIKARHQCRGTILSLTHWHKHLEQIWL